MLFLDRTDAEMYAKSIAQTNSRIGAGVYNNHYQTVSQFVSDTYVQQQARANSPSRLFLWTLLLLSAGSILIWIEIRSGWTLIFGFLIGSRLLLGAVFKGGKAIAALKKRST